MPAIISESGAAAGAAAFSGWLALEREPPGLVAGGILATSKSSNALSRGPRQTSAVGFDWDVRKAQANLRKHGVAFEEAATVFLDPLALTFPDPDHSNGEKREITVGYTVRQRVVFVAHCRRGQR